MRARPHAKALGVPDGPLSGLVRIDIDEHGDDVVDAVIRRAGDTPAKVRTASGKLHLIYAYNGERRLTGAPGKANARPWDDIRADLCGAGGYSISPPSMTNGGQYELLGDFTLEQLLQNRHRLPKIHGLESRAYRPKAEPIADDGEQIAPGGDGQLSSVPIGDRDAAFYSVVARICQRVHRAGGTKDDVMLEAMMRNAEFQMPLEESEVAAKVNHWWDETLAGRNSVRHRSRTRRTTQMDAGSRR
jgi:Bifunctional DNA primase/polymerase, N-terminal